MENSHDKGLSVFLKVDDVVKTILADDKNKVVKGNEGSLSNVTETGKTLVEDTKLKTTVGDKMSANSSMVDSSTTLPRLGRLKEFKIKGSVGGNAKDRIEFADLCFQMEEGKLLGHTQREIRSGVIKAMKVTDIKCV